MGILDTPGLSKQRPSTVATRIFGGRMGTFDNTTPKTFQITTELNQHFDAVRVIFANTDQITSHSMRSVAVSVMADKTDLNNAAGTWVTGTRNSLSRIYAEISPGAGRMAYTATDWIPISSVARTDGGTKPILVARSFMQASAALPTYGNGADNFQNWATRTDGRIWAARHQDGVQVTSGFTDTTNRNQSPIVGFQYLARGRVITVGMCGDSITDGRSTYLGEGFGLPAIDALSSMTGTAYEYMNIGWSGQASVTYAERAIDLLQSQFCPDILVFPTGTPNDITTTITQPLIDAARANRSRVTAEAARRGVTVVLWTWLPSNTAAKNYGATDSLRVAYNAEIISQGTRGLFVADMATAISGVTTGGQVQMAAGATTDDIHPNDAGNVILKSVIQSAIQQASRAV